MSEHSTETDEAARCGEHYDRHPDLPHLVAVCALPSGHEGEHSNVLPKTLSGPLGSACPRCGGREWATASDGRGDVASVAAVCISCGYITTSTVDIGENATESGSDVPRPTPPEPTP